MLPSSYCFIPPVSNLLGSRTILYIPIFYGLYPAVPMLFFVLYIIQDIRARK